MTEILPWFATVATIGGALLTASNLGTKITGSGFVVFLFGSLAWIGVGLTSGQRELVWTNAVLTFLNVFGIWRWLGRQAAVEEGAKAAAEASEQTPGEGVFPISLLTHAKVLVGGEPVGSCVDAMAGDRSGKLAYLIVSEGGVAGVGERLRKLPWNCARASDEQIVATIDKSRYAALSEVPKDEWPER